MSATTNSQSKPASTTTAPPGDATKAASTGTGSAPSSKVDPAAVDDEAEEGEITEEGEIVEESVTPRPPASAHPQPEAAGASTRAHASPVTPEPSPAKVDVPVVEASVPPSAAPAGTETFTQAEQQADSSQKTSQKVSESESNLPAQVVDAPTPAASAQPLTAASDTVTTEVEAAAPIPAASVSSDPTVSAQAEVDASSIQPAPAAFVGTTNADAAAEPDPLHPPPAADPSTASLVTAGPTSDGPAQAVEAVIEPATGPTETTAASANTESEAAAGPAAEPAPVNGAETGQVAANKPVPEHAAGDEAAIVARPEENHKSTAEAMDEDPAQGPTASTADEAAPKPATPPPPPPAAANQAPEAPAPAPAEQTTEDVEMADISAAGERAAAGLEADKASVEAKDLHSDGLDGVHTPAPASEASEGPQAQRNEEPKPSVAKDVKVQPDQMLADQAQDEDRAQLSSHGPAKTSDKDLAAPPTSKPEDEALAKGGKSAATTDRTIEELKAGTSAPPHPAEAGPKSTAQGAQALPPAPSEAPAPDPRPTRDAATVPSPAAASKRGENGPERTRRAGSATTGPPPVQPPTRERTRTPQGQTHRQQQPQQPQQQQSMPAQHVQHPPNHHHHHHQAQQVPHEHVRASRLPMDGVDPQERERKSRSHTSRPNMPDRERNSGSDRHSNRDRRREQESERERLERERERERERLRESERDREMMIARENEEARLIWLSLPGNDHPQYYTDTDSDSCYGDGGVGIYGTDEEDKDLDPPPPLAMQEHYPPPSTSTRLAAGSKRKSPARARSDAYGSGPHDAGPSRAHAKRRALAAAISPDYDLAIPALPLDAQTRGMISIDDFPVIDSSIRGEPEHRPLFNRDATFGHYDDDDDDDDESLPTSDSDEEASRIAAERKRRHGNRVGNRGNKLSRAKGVRWHRRGKLGGWTEARMEKEIGDRVRHRIETMQKDSIRALVAAMPAEDKKMLEQFPALRDGLLPAEAQSNGAVVRDVRGRLLPSDLSEAARLDAQLGLGPGAAPTLADGPFSDGSERLTSTLLAPTLLKPAVTARQLLTSHTLRHTFRNPHIGALGKTALDLIESEGVLGRAIGRCWSSMERGGWNVDPEPQVNAAEDEMDVEEAGINGQADGSSDDDGREVLASLTSNPALQHLDDLFVTRAGLAVPRLDEVGQPIFEQDDPSDPSSAAGPDGPPPEPRLATTLLPAMEQRAVVLAALECLHELAADSREYVERLEEVRSRLATIKRRRAEVWAAVREWAIDKEEKGEGEQTFHPVAAIAPAASGADASSLAPGGDKDGVATATGTLTAPAGARGENGMQTPTSSGGTSGKAAKGGTTTATAGSKARKKTTKAAAASSAAAGTSSAAGDKARAASPPPPPPGRSTVTSALAGVAFTSSSS